jgi:hypothetical protein
VTPDSKNQVTLAELETNKSIFFNITQSLNNSDQKNQKVFSFSSDKKDNMSVQSDTMASGDKGDKSDPGVSSIKLGMPRKDTLSNDSFTFDLIKKKIKEKTIEEPYKGAHLSDDKEGSMKEKLLGEVNKFLWLIFHDLNMKGTLLT